MPLGQGLQTREITSKMEYQGQLDQKTGRFKLQEYWFFGRYGYSNSNKCLVMLKPEMSESHVDA